MPVPEIITGNYRLLKDINSNVILNLVRTNAPISGAVLAKITGMRPSTVHNILKNLEKEKLVLKIGTGDSTKLGGRRPTLWKIRGNYGYVIGIQIAITEIEVVLVNLNSRIIDSQRLLIEQFNSLSEIDNKIVEILENLLKANNISNHRLLGIGIGVSGLVDISEGTILKTSLLAPSMQPIHIQKSLEQFFDVPIYIENDANAAALAEKWFGGVNGASNIVYTLIFVGRRGFGIGFGLILNHDIYRGSNMFAGETELFTLNIEKILKMKCGYDEENFIVGEELVNLNDLQLHHLIKALKYGSDYAASFFEEIGKIVGFELTRVINLLDPQMIVIGGEILNVNNAILDPIKKTVQNEFSQLSSRRIHITGSSLSQYSVALGAATIILKKIFQDPVIDNVRREKVV